MICLHRPVPTRAGYRHVPGLLGRHGCGFHAVVAGLRPTVRSSRTQVRPSAWRDDRTPPVICLARRTRLQQDGAASVRLASSPAARRVRSGFKAVAGLHQVKPMISKCGRAQDLPHVSIPAGSNSQNLPPIWRLLSVFRCLLDWLKISFIRGRFVVVAHEKKRGRSSRGSGGKATI